MDLGIRGLGPGVRIGLGASAAVYRARQEQLGRDVAVKLLTERDPSFVRRFEREALALGQLSRLPGILTVHDTGLTEQGEPYLVLQFCPSSLLDRLHREGPLAPDDAARLIARVAVTVAGAHEAGIVHRDLKPANILLSHEGEPLVADLGMASVLGAGITTSIGFTPGYAAPENLRGEAGGPDVDVYALGASLFQLVTGRVPFTDPSGLNNLVALAVAIDSQPVEDLRPLGVPDELCAVIEAAMAKEPSRRPTAAALAERLTVVADGISTAAHARPVAPEVRPRVQRLPAYGPAPATLDAPPDTGGDASPAAIGLLSPPRPGGFAPVGPPSGVPVDDRPPVSDLPEWARPRRAPPPDPYKVGLLPFKPWTRAKVDLFRRRPSSRQHRWLGNSAILAGAAVSATVVAILTSVLPGLEGGGEAQVAPTTATAAPFFTTTTGFDGVGGGTTTTMDPQQATASIATYQLAWSQGRDNALAALLGPGVLDAGRPATTSCPDGWSDTGGITGNSIAVDLLIPDRNDPTSEPARLAQGIATYLDWANSVGGIGPGQLQVSTRFVDPSSLNDAAAASQPFAVASLEPATARAVGDSLNGACVPQPLATPGDPVGDTTTSPWSTAGPELSRPSEARLWAELIQRRFGADGVAPTIVALVSDDPAGALYRQVFDEAMAAQPVGPVNYISSPQEFTTGPTGPIVLIVMASREACRTFLPALEGTSSMPMKLVAAPCVGPSETATLDAANGWFSFPGGLRDEIYSPSDSYQRLIDAQLAAAGLDPADPVIRKGFGLYGWLWHQSLEIAAALPGGLTRTNLVATERNLTGLAHPMLMEGIRLETGPTDPWPLEGSDASVWDTTGDRWIINEVVDVNGATPPCRWEGLSRSCQQPG